MIEIIFRLSNLVSQSLSMIQSHSSPQPNVAQPSDMANPPGSFLMWMIVFVEVLMFGVLFLIFARYRFFNMESFQAESHHLNIQDGILMTLALLISGFLAAEGVRYFFANRKRKSLVYFILSTLLGGGFLLLKILDFKSKVQMDLMIEKNDFWESYWLLMGFHFFHVIVGVLILASICIGIYKENIEDPEFSVRGGVLFWHMCDIVWLIILPLFYLGRIAI